MPRDVPPAPVGGKGKSFLQPAVRIDVETDWVDRSAYPFAPHYFDTGEGRMHYVDEGPATGGPGGPVLFVHGTPTWSFLYRHLIAGLAGAHRVVAVDHLGFGLSDKPEGAAYRPEDHARRLAALVDHLGLRDFALAVHDFGGPIGLSYAVEHPERVRRLVLFNTWMWSLRGRPAVERAGRLLGGPVGRLLYRRLNFSPRVLIPAAVGDRRRLTKAVHRQYLAPFPRPADRQAPWALAAALTGSTGWYESLWQRRDRLAGKPVLLAWGLKDPAFGPADLARWQDAFPRARVLRFPDAGHFVPEEEGPALVAPVAAFLREGAAGE